MDTNTEQATPVDVGVSDAELFSGAALDEAPAERPEVVAEPEQTTEPDKPTQPRDEKGQYAKIEDKPAEAQPQEKPVEAKPAVDDNAAQVPSWRVREINEEKRELAAKLAAAEAERQTTRQQFEHVQRQLAQLQKPPEQPKETKPDPLLDPDGYEKWMDQRVESRLRDQQRDFDMRLAHRTHGKVFEEAYAEAQKALASGDVQLRARMNSASSPGEELVAWHKERKTMQEVGNDPNAWLQKKLEESLSDPAFLAKAIEKAKGAASAVTQARPAVELPPSLSSGTRADNRTSDDTDVSDEGLFKYATR